MEEMIKARFSACKNHPERQEIFKLESLLIRADYPYYFNVWEELRPTPFNSEPGNPETDINWDEYNFLIQIGAPVGTGLTEISICFNTEGDKTLLELLDLRNANAEGGELHRDLNAEQAMELIKEFFKA